MSAALNKQVLEKAYKIASEMSKEGEERKTFQAPSSEESDSPGGFVIQAASKGKAGMLALANVEIDGQKFHVGLNTDDDDWTPTARNPE